MTDLSEPLRVSYISNYGEIRSKLIENNPTDWLDNNLVGWAFQGDKWCIYKSEKFWICADISGNYTIYEPITIKKEYFKTFDEAIMYGLTLV